MLPFDFEEVIREGLLAQRRPEDGLLHPSGDLMGSLRHAQLRIAGAPTLENPLLSEIRLNTGTMWHRWLEENMLRRYPEGRIYTEKPVTAGLPGGWAGTADYLIWSPEFEAFVLADLKTTKGEGMSWIERDGAKDDHLMQASAYWYALEAMGFPLVKGFAIMYLAMNTVPKEPNIPAVSVQECLPLPKEPLWNLMEDRWAAVGRYVEVYENTGDLVNDMLAPPMEREQKLVRNRKIDGFDLVLKPNWRAQFCPFPNELCDCSEQGQTKIGQFVQVGDAWLYEPREGFEDVSITTQPDGDLVTL